MPYIVVQIPARDGTGWEDRFFVNMGKEGLETVGKVLRQIARQTRMKGLRKLHNAGFQDCVAPKSSAATGQLFGDKTSNGEVLGIMFTRN